MSLQAQHNRRGRVSAQGGPGRSAAGHDDESAGDGGRDERKPREGGGRAHPGELQGHVEEQEEDAKDCERLQPGVPALQLPDHQHQGLEPPLHQLHAQVLKVRGEVEDE